MSTRRSTRIRVEQPEETVIAPPEPRTQATFTAKEILALIPEPIMEPTQRQYGEEFYPKYVQFYNKVRDAAQ